jgi:peptidoglycan/xylan/chitin deacetylase (PgdA/CDA1 family)
MYRLLLLWLLDILGVNALCRMLNRNKAVILLYHGVCDDSFNLLKGCDERHISKSAFRKHLEYLKRKRYVFMSMTELTDSLKNKEKVDKSVVLTFDDGFRNIVENAYPIMKEFGAKGCFYLVSDLIGTEQLLWTDHVETVIRNQQKGDFQFIFKGEKINYRVGDKSSNEHAMIDIKKKLRTIPDKERLEYLEQFRNVRLDDVPNEFIMASWKQIRELELDVLEIGSHTRRHSNCMNFSSNEELEDEIRNSKIIIENNTGRKIKHFCYPAGSYDDRVITKLTEYGYESAVTITDGFVHENSDLFRLKRIGTGEQFLRFKAYLSGSYFVLQRIINCVIHREHL